MIFKRIAAWIAYEIREEKITLSSQDAKRILMDVAPPVSPDVFSENRSREIRYDLTIIVPVYNSENWLKECMESIVLQKTIYLDTDVELIRSLDDLLETDGYIGFEKKVDEECDEVYVNTGQGFGASAFHPVVKAMMDIC